MAFNIRFTYLYLSYMNWSTCHFVHIFGKHFGACSTTISYHENELMCARILHKLYLSPTCSCKFIIFFPG